MRTFTISCILTTVLFFALTTTTTAAQKSRNNLRTTRKVLTSPANYQALKTKNFQNYKSVTSKIKVNSKLRQSYDARFQKFPVSVQRDIISTIKDSRITVIKPPIASKLPPMITSVTGEISPGGFGLIRGNFLHDKCKVFADLASDLLLETHYIWEVLIFKVPSNRPYGSLQVYVRDTNSNKKSTNKTIDVVAPRGYRGIHGFNFPNFSTPTISWSIFKNYFGANEVEYANGTRRPAAEEWYNSRYKGIGSGGDCYGMCMRSIRIRRNDWRGNHSAWWPSNKESRVWDYAKTNEVANSIRWDQGGQLSAQAAAVIADKQSNQNHQDAFNFIKNKIATHQSGNQPILGMWSNNGGHAVVAYKTAVSGNDQKIYLWDNNKPYRTNVEDDANSVAKVRIDNKAFSYGNYHTMIAFTFNEMNPADPNLPASAAGNMNSLSASTTIVTCDKPGAIKQIRDERGRTLLDAKGMLNKNPRTRIPDAGVFRPFSPNRRPHDHIGNFNAPIYIFNKSKGKNLVIDFSSGSDVNVRSFSRGTVNVIKAKKGRIALTNLLKPNHTMDIIDPSFTKPAMLKIIKASANKTERVFDITPKGTLPDKVVKFGLNAAGTDLVVTNKSTTKLNLSVNARKFAPNGKQMKKPVMNLNILGGKNKSLNLR